MIKNMDGKTLTPKLAAAQLVWAALPKTQEYDGQDVRDPLITVAGIVDTDLTERETKLIFAQYEKLLARVKKMLKVT